MIFHFDHFVLNSETRTLSSDDVSVTLTPKVFQTLLVLVQNRHRVMTKAELFEELWPRQVVEEANLTQNISMLRKALKEATHGKRYIATFHGHGYRFVEPVKIEEEDVPFATGTALPSSHTASTVLVQQPETAWTGDAPAKPSTEGVATGQSPKSDRHGAVWLLALACLLISVAGGLLLVKRLRATPKTPAPPSAEARTLVRLEGAQYQPSWSADGKKLVFIDMPLDGRGSAIEVLSVADTNPKRVQSGEGAFSSPVWSPDGRSIAFIQSQDGTAEIRILSLADGSSRTLTKLFPHRYGLDFRHMDWSPDGNLLVVDDKVVETDPLSLYLVNVKDGSKFRLTYPDMDMIGDAAPRFSPDGSQVAFIRAHYQLQNSVMIVPVTGGKPRDLNNEVYRLGDVDWQTNDLVVFSGRFGNQFQFWRSDLRQDPGHATQVLPFGTEVSSQISIARHSGQMAFSAYEPDLNIWSLDLNKGNAAAGTWRSVIRTPGQDLEPFVSPDGAKLAFRSDATGKLQLWVSSLNGTERRPLDTGGLVPSAYCWMSDSNAVIFSARLQPGLYTASASGAGFKKITDLHLSHPSCAPDGSSIYAIDNNFVYRLSLPDNKVEKISDIGGAPIRPSSDGRYIYMAHGRMGSIVSQLDLQTGAQKVVTSDLAPGYSGCWALSSQGIFFLKMKNDGAVIQFHDLTTGQERTVVAFPGNLPPVGLSQLSISPDEKTIYVVRADPVSSDIKSISLN